MPNESVIIQAIGWDIQISNAIVPELDFTYYLNKNWVAYLILCTTNHNAKAIGTIAGDIALGNVWLLPPKCTSGLIEALAALKTVKGVATVYLDDKDVIRHRLVKKIINAYKVITPNK